MSSAEIAHNLGAVVTLSLGILGLVWPQRAASLVGIRPQGRLGRSEIRATYGGLFAALGLFVLVLQSAPAFRVVGVAWLGASLGRIVSVFVDRSRSPKNVLGLLVEIVLAGLLLFP